MNKSCLTRSFKNAWKGIIYALKTERNLKLHFAFAVMVLVGLFVFRISGMKLAIILMTIGFVIVTELVNTTIECLVDLIQPEFHELAGYAKDIAAGAVLVAAFIAVLIGIVVFGPYLIQLLS